MFSLHVSLNTRYLLTIASSTKNRIIIQEVSIYSAEPWLTAFPALTTVGSLRRQAKYVFANSLFITLKPYLIEYYGFIIVL